MSSSLTVPTDVTAPDIRNASDASVVPDENSVTAINMRNRAILYESNHPNHSFEPSVLNLVNNMPNDEASESRFFTRASERTAITTALLDGAADALEASTSQPLSQSPENPSEQKKPPTRNQNLPLSSAAANVNTPPGPQTAKEKTKKLVSSKEKNSESWS